MLAESSDDKSGALPHDAHDDADLLAAAMALADKRVVVLTGAGISTESGIPDYRGPETRRRARQPMRFAEFTASDSARRRYWARATLGWPRVRDAQPNAAHLALAAGNEGVRGVDAVSGVITQNVDGLHQRAGAGDVVELHGALREVVCLACHAVSSRDDVHARLLEANPLFRAGDKRLPHSGDLPDGARPLWGSGLSAALPDGDVELSDDDVAGFVVVACSRCSGPLKPRVVFFGENVPAPVLSEAWAVFERAQALVVVGSSLEVFSGRRFVIEAHKRALPIVIVNATPTRADDLATVVVRGSAGRVLPALFR